MLKPRLQHLPDTAIGETVDLEGTELIEQLSGRKSGRRCGSVAGRMCVVGREGIVGRSVVGR